MDIGKIFNDFLYISLSLGILSSFSCSKKNPTKLENNYGILEGIVKIDPSPYSIGVIGGAYGAGGTPFVTVGLLGESNTTDWIGG